MTTRAIQLRLLDEEVPWELSLGDHTSLPEAFLLIRGFLVNVK